jgi:hypothetical protein
MPDFARGQTSSEMSRLLTYLSVGILCLASCSSVPLKAFDPETVPVIEAVIDDWTIHLSSLGLKGPLFVDDNLHSILNADRIESRGFKLFPSSKRNARQPALWISIRGVERAGSTARVAAFQMDLGSGSTVQYDLEERSDGKWIVSSQHTIAIYD